MISAATAEEAAGLDVKSAENEPDADFFEMVLETDLANIIKKAQTGQPLTKREREMIEDERSKRAAKKPTTAFRLEGGGDDHELRLENMSQKELAVEWGYSYRQLKNWIHDGRKANDPAPVTRPEEMPAWFRRIYAPRECPEKLRLAAQRVISGNPKKTEPTHEASQPLPRIEIPDAEKGLLAMLDRYRVAEVTLHNKYMAAVDAGDETRSSFLLSEWSKMGEKVRSLEKTAPKALEELRIYVRRDEIQREIESLHAAILKAFSQAFRLGRTRMKSSENAESWGLCVDEIITETRTMLVETEFSEPLELATP